VQRIQSRPDDLTDPAALQRMAGAQQAFAQKWQQEPIKASREALQSMRMWGLNGGDPRLAKQAEAMFAQRADQHAQLLVQKYSGAPELLEDAMDFITMQSLEKTTTDARVASIKTQAAKLGDDASAKKRYLLASEYYDVAGEPAKAQAAREKQNQVAMQRMQPSIDQLQRQAAELQKQYSDPAKVHAMREQAEAARKSIQQQQAASKAANKKGADDLEKQLGL
jgi:myosin heavy subunit